MNDVLDILIILDRSGSMESARADHEGGLRSFIRDQRDMEGDVRLTLTQFDSQDPCEIILDRKPLDQVNEETIRLIPRGGTPLLDGIGRAVAHLRAQGPSRVIAMVITDGEENDSKEWTKAKAKALVTDCEKSDWTFLFLGANIDAFDEAGTIGINRATTANFLNNSPASVGAMYSHTASNVKTSRGLAASGSDTATVSRSLSYSNAQLVSMSNPLTVSVDIFNANTGVTSGTLPSGSDSQPDKETA